MTHEDQSTVFDELVQLLADHGFDGMAEASLLIAEVGRRSEADED